MKRITLSLSTIAAGVVLASCGSTQAAEPATVTVTPPAVTTTVVSTVTVTEAPAPEVRDDASLAACKEWDDANRDGLLGWFGKMAAGESAPVANFELAQMMTDYMPTNPSLASAEVSEAIRAASGAVAKLAATLPSEWSGADQTMLADALVAARSACTAAGYNWG